MNRIPARNVWTTLIALVIAIGLPVTVFAAFRLFMSRFITNDNAGIVFDQFQAALDSGSIVRDPIAASDVATRAYWNKTQAIPLDGWGHTVRISAVIHGDSCELIILSAGRDGTFGSGDDVTIERSFDLSTKRPVATQP